MQEERKVNCTNQTYKKTSDIEVSQKVHCLPQQYDIRTDPAFWQADKNFKAALRELKQKRVELS